MIHVEFTFYWAWIPLVVVAAALAASFLYCLAMLALFCWGPWG